MCQNGSSKVILGNNDSYFPPHLVEKIEQNLLDQYKAEFGKRYNHYVFSINFDAPYMCK